MRISNAERQDIADTLSKHYAEGRLDSNEFDERVGRVMSAKTRGDVAGVLDDLPRLGPPPPEPRRRRPLGPWVVALLLLLLVASIAAVPPYIHVPWLLVGRHAHLPGRALRPTPRRARPPPSRSQPVIGAIDWRRGEVSGDPRPVQHLTTDALEAGLEEVRRAPADGGHVELIVRRPAVDGREVLREGHLDPSEGLVGDTWRVRGSSRTANGAAHPEMQLTVMNSRAATLVAGDLDRRALAGDQLYVDLDVSRKSLPPGSRLEIGSAVIEITDQPHRGCAKFAARFGRDALRFVNSEVGCELNLRGVNAKVIVGGRVRVGDPVRRVRPEAKAR